MLVPPDDPTTIADAVARLVANPTHAAELGAAARRSVAARYGAAAMVRRLEAIYDAVAGATPRPVVSAVARGERGDVTRPEVCR